MKVLVTGATPTQVGGGDPFGASPLVGAVAEGLSTLGHKVERRPVVVGEDLSRFHRVIVFMAPPLSITAKYLYGALWALASHRHPLISVDDWQLSLLVNNAASCSRENYKRLWDSMAAGIRRDRVSARKHAQVLEAVVKNIGQRLWSWPLGIPMFPWGDATKFPMRSTEKMVAYDPSPLVEQYQPKMSCSFRQREEKWLLPTLANHTKWLERQPLKLPVEYVGGTQKMRRERGLASYTARYLVEEVFPLYQLTLAVPYPHKGSGWWRPRYLHAAWAVTALGGDVADTAVIGEAYNFTLTQLEEASPRRRLAIADAQAERLKQWDLYRVEKFLSELTRWLAA